MHRLIHGALVQPPSKKWVGSTNTTISSAPNKIDTASYNVLLQQAISTLVLAGLWQNSDDCPMYGDGGVTTSFINRSLMYSGW